MWIGFLCPLSANTYNIEFLSFTIRDYETKKKIFEVGRDIPSAAAEIDIDYSNFDEDSFRKIKYEFSEDVLRLPTIGTSYVVGFLSFLFFEVRDDPFGSSFRAAVNYVNHFWPYF